MRIALLQIFVIICFGILSIDRQVDSFNLYRSLILGSIRNVTSDATNFLSHSIQKQKEMMLRVKNTAVDYVSNAVAVPRNMLYHAKNATKDYIDNATSKGMESKFRTIAESFRFEMRYGIPSLDIPILDPLNIKHMEHQLRNKNIGNLSIIADNVTISGLSTFVTNDVRISVSEGLNIALNLSVPIIHAQGSYQMNGTAGTIFPVNGSGPFDIEVRGSNCYVATSLGYSSAMYIKKLGFDFSIVSLHGKFEHLYRSEKVDDVMNKVILNVGSKILEIIKPKVTPEIERFLAHRMNSSLAGLTMTNIIGMLTTEVYFPDFVRLSDRILRPFYFN